MRQIILVIAGICFLGLAAVPATAQSAGDRVLANFQNSGYWFAGVIAEVSDEGYKIKYDDGDRETVSARAVRSYNWAVGTRIECNWKNKGKWYPGVISAANGKRLSVNYDDGDSETTQTALCRSR